MPMCHRFTYIFQYYAGLPTPLFGPSEGQSSIPIWRLARCHREKTAGGAASAEQHGSSRWTCFHHPAETIEPNNGPSRASAGILLESLDDIIGKCKDKVGYLCAERSRSGLPIIHAAPSLGNRGSRAAMQLWRWPFHRVGVGGQTSWSPDTGTMVVRCMTVRSPGELTLRIYRSAFYYGP